MKGVKVNMSASLTFFKLDEAQTLANLFPSWSQSKTGEQSTRLSQNSSNNKPLLPLFSPSKTASLLDFLQEIPHLLDEHWDDFSIAQRTTLRELAERSAGFTDLPGEPPLGKPQLLLLKLSLFWSSICLRRNVPGEILQGIEAVQDLVFQRIALGFYDLDEGNELISIPLKSGDSVNVPWNQLPEYLAANQSVVLSAPLKRRPPRK